MYLKMLSKVQQTQFHQTCVKFWSRGIINTSARFLYIYQRKMLPINRKPALASSVEAQTPPCFFRGEFLAGCLNWLQRKQWRFQLISSKLQGHKVQAEIEREASKVSLGVNTDQIVNNSPLLEEPCHSWSQSLPASNSQRAASSQKQGQSGKRQAVCQHFAQHNGQNMQLNGPQLPESQAQASSKQPLKSKSRKTRTTITKQKLLTLRKIFEDYRNKERPIQRLSPLELKAIGKELSLSYSTIAHRYLEFRKSNRLAMGALISSQQKKRKYCKSLECEQAIKRALRGKTFTSAKALAEYIYKTQGKRYSRAIIYRQYRRMQCESQAFMNTPSNRSAEVQQIRRIYSYFLYPLLKGYQHTILYVDELVFSPKQFDRSGVISGSRLRIEDADPEDSVSLFVAATIDGIVKTGIKIGLYSREEFLECLCDSLIEVSQKIEKSRSRLYRNILVITDIKPTHYDPLQKQASSPEATADRPFAALMDRYNAQRFFLPPYSPQLNPLEPYFYSLKSTLLQKGCDNVFDLYFQLDFLISSIEESVEPYFYDVNRLIESLHMEHDLILQLGQEIKTETDLGEKREIVECSSKEDEQFEEF